MVYPWTVTDNVNFIIGYLMGQWKIAIEAFFVICTFINNGKGAVSAGYFIDNKRKVLIDKGRISHKQAIEKAEKEFAIYRKREMDLLESDFDKEIKRLKDKNDNNPN